MKVNRTGAPSKRFDAKQKRLDRVARLGMSGPPGRLERVSAAAAAAADVIVIVLQKLAQLVDETLLAFGFGALLLVFCVVIVEQIVEEAVHGVHLRGIVRLSIDGIDQ